MLLKKLQKKKLPLPKTFLTKKMKNQKKIFSFSEVIAQSSLPRLETELLLSYLIKKDRVFIITHPEKTLNNKQILRYKELEKKRLKNWPIAYLIGTKSFFSLDFKVTSAVLVPRPETEIMLEAILNEAKKLNDNKIKKIKINFFDIGTGSGAIIISLAAALKEKTSKIYKDSSFFAADISNKALLVARENAQKHRLKQKIDFRKSDLLFFFKKELAKAGAKKEPIIIAANLPYLNPEEMKEKSISREPKIALLSGENGLKHYQKLFIFLSKDEYATKITFSLYCEINPGQTKAIKTLARQYFPNAKISLIQDLSKRNRFCNIKNIL